jgi:hypothetical protein
VTDKITAPWTPDQVDRLNRFQRLGHVHEFTCPYAHDGADRTLVATKAGWICPHCDYRQDWAHAMMLEVPPPPFAEFSRDDMVDVLHRYRRKELTADSAADEIDSYIYGVVNKMRVALAADLHTALEESVKLQSHYAGILNDHDGGTRLLFANADAWIARLRATGTLK